MEKIELLLPAGNKETLVAAVENGADAVYLGLNRFNARRRADNFKLEEIKEIVDYCHKQGVKVYVAMNILVKNNEINDFFQAITKLYLAGTDALIIQHLSFLPIIKKNFPDMEVHLSTQAAITNTKYYDLIKLADKVILPREYSREEINNFIQKTRMPVEIFVQGALCFSYSGKCLFSSFLGGRSGNRGLCAQPCRKKYNGRYLLSMKDLCLIKRIPEIIEMGVSSLKIEGRLRSPKYVAAAAKAYREAIDSYYSGNFKISENYFKEMKLAFNREFTEGYYAESNDLVSDEQSMGRGLFLGEMGKNNMIKLQEALAVGDGVAIWLPDKVDGAVLRKIELNGKIVTEAKKNDTIKLYIRATPGSKIYKTSSIKKAKELIFLRNKPLVIDNRTITNLALPLIKVSSLDNKELLVKVYSAKDAQTALKYTNKVFYDIFAPDFNSNLSAFIPRILNDDDVEKAISLISKHRIKNILIGDLGVYIKLKDDKSLNLYLDYSNNIFNDFDLDFFLNSIPIISPELSFAELKQFKNKNFAVLVHGRTVMMNTKYPWLPKEIKDEKGYIFPVRKEHNYCQVLNSKEHGLLELVNELNKIGIKKYFLDLDNNVAQTLKIYNLIISGKKASFPKFNLTKGHWDKGME